jgi:hypothetical protein
VNRNFRIILVIFSLLLISCRSQLDAPATAPSNFTVTPGDGQAVLNWDAEPGLIYTAYYKVGSEVTLADYINLYSPISPPFTVTGLANQTQYAFILNASNQGSVPGPTTPVVTVTPGASGTGSSWTVGASLTASALRGIAFGGHNFVAVGDGGSLFTASDSNNSSGVSNWSLPPTTLPISNTLNISSVIFTTPNFVVMAADGSIMISADTVTWNLATGVGSGVGMNSLAYGGGTYVAVGAAGTIATNTTADISVAWTPQTSGTTQDLYGVSYADGMFVAVGKTGTLLTSPDGVAWTVQTSGTINNLYQVAYGANIFVAVGDGGTIVSSPNGINWAPQTPTVATNLYAISFGAGSKFVAVGTAGSLLYSTLGAEGTWTESSAGSLDLYSIVSAGVFVAVGAGGANVSGT